MAWASSQSDLDRAKRATGAVLVDGELKGTAYMVQAECAVTSSHVVAATSTHQDAKALDVEILLPEGLFRVVAIKRHLTADAALLTLDRPASAPPLRLARRSPLMNVEWLAVGYPAIASDPTARQPASLKASGRIDDPRGGDSQGKEAIQLWCEHFAAGLGASPQGFSGSAVMVRGEVVGHLNRIIGSSDITDNNRLRAEFGIVHACQASAVLELLGREKWPPSPALDLYSRLLQDMAGWGRSPSFEGITIHGTMPPLRDIYVEPSAMRVSRGHGEQSAVKPFRDLVWDLLFNKEQQAVLICGDFGTGKSTCARVLASKLATEHIADPVAHPWFPVFVPLGPGSADAAPSDTLVREALARHVRALEPVESLQIPDSTPCVRIFDGLDEVGWDKTTVQRFLESLLTDGQHKTIVFSRPGVVPSLEMLFDIQRIDILPFHTVDLPEAPPRMDETVQSTTRPTPEFTGPAVDQVSKWLEQWRALTPGESPTIEDLKKQELLGVCTTPIVLYMTAAIWDKVKENPAATRTMVFEEFLLAAAYGKPRHGRRHSSVTKASSIARDKLVHLGEVAGNEDVSASMLWLMSRIAWESMRHARLGRPLLRDHIATILREELAVTDAAEIETVSTGVTLAIQAEPTGTSERIMFGHKSFCEFLVAHYWACTLRGFTAHRRLEDINRRLVGARLIEPGNGALDRLLEILHGPSWKDEDREDIVEWAKACFPRESTTAMRDEKGYHRDERAPILQEAALAIGARLSRSRFFQINGRELHRMLAGFWAAGEKPLLRSPCLSVDKARFHGLDLVVAAPKGRLPAADFQRANLTDSDLTDTDLTRANFSGAVVNNTILDRACLEDSRMERVQVARSLLRSINLRGAALSRSYFVSLDLSGADLTGANLEEAVIIKSNLTDAVLSGADLTRARLQEVQMERTVFSKAVLKSADLSQCDLSGAALEQADATGASFERAELRGAKLGRAILSKAVFRSAGLEGADLHLADLVAADLSYLKGSGASLAGALLLGATLKSAVLTGADLTGTLLGGTDLRGADLSGASAEGLSIQGATFDDNTRWPTENFDPEERGAAREG